MRATSPTPNEERALEFLAGVFSPTRNHGPPKRQPGQRQRNSGRGWLHYYLWTVERAMVLAERALLGKRDWYRGRIAVPASVVIALVGAYWFVERTLL